MTNDQELLAAVRGALIIALPDDTPHDVIKDAVASVVEVLHAPWFPMSEKRVVGASNVNVRATPMGEIIGTLKQGVGVRAGKSEKGSTPVLIHAWISSELLG
jgi:hypothetical protein